jgi:signal peptidase I
MHQRLNKEPWLAVLLSSLCTGLGHAYAGHLIRAILLFIANLSLVIAIFWSLLSPTCPLNVTWTLVIIYAVFSLLVCIDAFRLTRRSNSIDFELERKSHKDPWRAAFCSLLLPGLGHFYLRRWLFGIGFFLGIPAIKCLVAKLLSEPSGLGVTSLFPVLFCYIASWHAYVSTSHNRQNPLGSLVRTAWIVILLGALSPWLFAFLIKYNFAEAFRVTSSSMSPTVMIEDRLLVNRLAYCSNGPERNDIVLFIMPQDFGPTAGNSAIKRIVGLPGETVQLKDGVLYIDGEPGDITEDTSISGLLRHYKYAESKETTTPKQYQKFAVMTPYVIPQDCYFLIGDNVSQSSDSRFFGALPRTQIKGKVTKIYWPAERATLLYE